jgi:short-subunit dehydrogenase
MSRLDGKLVFVSGASSGIGLHSAKAAARAGAEVVLLARRQQQLDALKAEIEEAGGKAHAYAVDLGDKDASAAVVARLQQDLRTPDVIFNNAGAGTWIEVDAQTLDDAEDAMEVPYRAALRLTLPFLSSMVERGSGLIVNTTSPAALFNLPGSGVYSIARVAMRSFTEVLNEDLRGTGVRAALFMPSEVSSDYFDKHPGTHARIPWPTRWVGVTTPVECGDAFVRLVERPRPLMVLPPVRGALVYWVNRWAPWLVAWILRSTGWRRPRLTAGSRGESER